MFCPECGAQAADTQKFCVKCGTGFAASRHQRAVSPPPAPPPLPAVAFVTPPAVRSGNTGSKAQILGVPDDVYATFWSRASAFAVDYVIIVFACGFLRGLMGITVALGGSNQSFFWLTVLALWVYKAAMESSARQATLGKLALDIKVTSLSGERIGFWRAVGRNFSQVLSAIILYIGYLMAAFTKRRQALHDMIAGTLVTRRQFSPSQITAAAASLGTQGKQVAESRPELPLKLSFRDAWVGSGKRAVFQNLSDNTLEIVLDVRSPRTGAHFRYAYVINARAYGVIERTQGRPFVPGQLVTVSNPDYRPIVQTVS